jgi:arylsulfatase A-like enzyme
MQPFDLYATLCELAGVSAPAGLDSRSLVEAMAGNGGGRQWVCSVYRDVQRMVTDGRWKLMVYRVDGAERVQLFDLATDPDECCDLAGEGGQAWRIAGLRAKLQTWQAATGDRWFGSIESVAR